MDESYEDHLFDEIFNNNLFLRGGLILDWNKVFVVEEINNEDTREEG